MNKFKKIIILLLFIIFTISVLYISSILKRSHKTIESNPKSSFAKPEIPKLYSGKTKVNLLVDKNSFNFPSSIPLLEIKNTNSLDLNEALNIAKSFDVKTAVKTTNDIYEGPTYYWVENNFSLTIYSKSKRIIYENAVEINTVDKQLDDEDFERIAKKFLNEKIEIQADDIVFLSFDYLSGTKNSPRFTPTTRDKANVFVLHYTSKIPQATIIPLNPNESLIELYILLDGSILKANINLPPNINKTIEKFKLKNYEEVLQEINNAAIISLDNGNINIPDLKSKEIEKIDIDKINLYYLLDKPQAKVLKPIYLLEGKATLNSTNKDVKAILYLPAIKS